MALQNASTSKPTDRAYRPAEFTVMLTSQKFHWSHYLRKKRQKSMFHGTGCLEKLESAARLKISMKSLVAARIYSGPLRYSVRPSQIQMFLSALKS
mmetsp:Transcript_155947/g.291037  ORF Transcript_155947/g.291037 Transcript_155947/m.291037 type:complete len:96 (-) Transcript_155947:106-393(-)